jgi:hypothetical protein
MSLRYTLIGNEDGESNIVALIDGELKPMHSSNPNFEKVLEGLRAGDDSIAPLFDLAVTVAKKFQRLSERVTTANGRLYLDGVEVDNTLAEQVLRFLEEGVEDWLPLVKFFENVQANPLEHSREQLYTWLSRRDFTISPEGMIVGYKGVAKDSDGTFVSIHSGKAIVDGQEVSGRIPNKIGSVIEMPRDAVQHDPSVGCHQGLHIGTYDYASSFGQHLLEVHVNPRDVVSVPTDCDWAKVRACRYVVVDTIDRPYTSALLSVDFAPSYEDGWGDFEDDEADDGCGDDSCRYCY